MKEKLEESDNQNKSHIQVFDTRFALTFVNQTIHVLYDNKEYQVQVNDIDLNPIKLEHIVSIDKLVAVINIETTHYLLVLENEGLWIRRDNGNPLFNTVIEHNYDIGVSVKITNGYFVQIMKGNSVIFEFDNFFTTDEMNETLSVELNTSQEESRFIVVALVNSEFHHLVITYDIEKAEINVFKILVKKIKYHPSFKIEIVNRNQLRVALKNGSEEDERIIDIRKANRKAKKWFEADYLNDFSDEHILLLVSINKRRYYVYNQKNGIFFVRSNPYRVSRLAVRLFASRLPKGFLLYGRFKHNAYNSQFRYDQIYLQNEKKKLGKFIRPFKKIKLLNQFGFILIPYYVVQGQERVHVNLMCGDDQHILHNVKLKYHDIPVKTLKIKRYENDMLIMRTNLHGNITLTKIPFSQEYTFASRIKKGLGKFIGSFLKHKTINLFFEKKSMKADESSFRVFEKVKKRSDITSTNVFVLDKNSTDYSGLKKKYNSSLITKYSMKHYIYTFASSHFISSELPNHLFNDRLYIDDLRDKLMHTPSVFLQHGIMFAKPVDNPMAMGFHKENNQYNIIKNVISSDLEAEQFYKMGYSHEELMKTGLATLDYAKLDNDANKIAYMPTYRFWEEQLIYSGKIEQTTYYKSIMKVIRLFEENQLLDRLMVIPHNKFSEYIFENMSEYKDVIAPNPSEALKKAIVFITDYSSAIYDAIYRGAYPIFYWEEKSYLIESYRAIPPVNESNAPGPIAKSRDDLLRLVKNALDRDCQLEEEYREKYKKINEFHDNKNTERIISILQKEHIL
ncbi:CDP-glycerol glycerophosphotransferase family protein [Virgibacillus soli]|uniref:CDP-glycerol glycerophosphotransferase family protein n=1 Tax=Paracerasibacillus soli TaxID=480284 RepID=UPI0035EECAF8